ncbi:pilus assembly protein [[Pseudomonas] boreopolis]|uniref:pilus assembly protein n=1 Tax=Xanthomonas boreopolis TaxID=86183 RepID=UPI003D4B3FE1
MTFRRKRLAALAIVLAALASYGLFNAFSIQGQGELAQSPLNIDAPKTPAFIMAVDDSNSMTFERIFPGGDGRLQWNSGNASFFQSAGVFYNVGAGCSNNSPDCLLYLFPHSGYNASYSPGRAIPPLDAFGFARSPAYNKGYFDPNVVYQPWLNPDGKTRWSNADPENARADPRDPAVYGSSFARAYNVVYNLKANRANTTETFSLLNGMSIPDLAGRGMKYYSNSQWRTSARSITSNTSIAFDYFPATFYLPENQAAPAGYKTGDEYRPIVRNACGPGCNLRRYEIKPDNYDSGYNDAIQNFANWFQYHRNRLLAMVGSMTESMAAVDNMRVGYFTINNRVKVDMRDIRDPSGKSALYDQMLRLQAGGLITSGSGGTPNRSAVAHLGSQFSRAEEDGSAPILNACQKNAGMLFTDGITNASDKVSGYGNADGGLGSPFADNYGDTIADIAASYYNGANVPLRTGDAFPRGLVKVPKQCAELDRDSPDWKRLDCQANLHMNFYGIVLGAGGRIYGANEAATKDPYANPPLWNTLPNPSSVDDGTAVDEIWHGTINTRGEFVNAQTPAEVTAAMRRILSLSGEGNSPSGSLSLTGSRIGTGSFSVTPSYEATNNGTDWYSKLTAQSIATNVITGEVKYTTLWEASAKLPDAANRNIYYGGADGTAREFSSTTIGLADLCSNTANGMSRCNGRINDLGIDAAQAIAYLRGDQSLESSESTPLRKRTTRLGDIVNSTPVISAPTDDFGYRSIYNAALNRYDAYGYAAYMTAKKDRKPIVYVGANDGMLHAFDGKTGAELFAYVPQAVLGHMGNLLFPYKEEDKDYQVFQHRYYVDGPVAVADVASSAGNWRTVLVGTTGAGAKGAFALDVTRPDSFDAGDVLWDINGNSSDAIVASNIGHVLGRPVIVPVKNANGSASWKAIFGNGYGSANGRAALFVVDIRTGKATVIQAIESGVAGSNGLGNIVVVDRWSGDGLTRQTRDGFADTVYAADQNGAIWKFDLRQVPANPSNSSTLAAVTVPLFVARDSQNNRQPILGGIQAAAGPAGGVMVYFGTGAFSFVNDENDVSKQTLYAVLDRGDGRTLGRADLQVQTVVAADDGSRTMVANAMGVGKRGWYIDLPGRGERFVGYPEIANGIVFFPTYELGVVSSCGPSGTNWLYGLNALTGAPALSGLRIGSLSGAAYGSGTAGIGLRTDGSAPVKDVAVMSTSRLTPLSEGATESELAKALEMQCSMVVQASGAEAGYMPRACGRQSWRQVK